MTESAALYPKTLEATKKVYLAINVNTLGMQQEFLVSCGYTKNPKKQMQILCSCM